MYSGIRRETIVYLFIFFNQRAARYTSGLMTQHLKYSVSNILKINSKVEFR